MTTTVITEEEKIDVVSQPVIDIVVDDVQPSIVVNTETVETIVDSVDETVIVNQIDDETVVYSGMQGPMGPQGPVAFDKVTLTASENLAAGDFVNVFSGGVRKSSALSLDTIAHGFVKLSALATESVDVYFSGLNEYVSGVTVGNVFLSETAGLITNTPPSSVNSVVQKIGVAVAINKVNFQPNDPILISA